MTNIQLIADFEDPDLKLMAFGKPAFTEFTHSFENIEYGGSIGSGTSSMTQPIVACDDAGNACTLNVPEEYDRMPGINTIFETTAKAGAPLTVQLPAIGAYYQKVVAELAFSIPKDGEMTMNKELDFIIQKDLVKSIRRISENTAGMEFELNTGSDAAASIIDLGAYSEDIIKAETVISGDNAVITMTFNQDIEEARFSFTWPRFAIEGN